MSAQLLKTSAHGNLLILYVICARIQEEGNYHANCTISEGDKARLAHGLPVGQRISRIFDVDGVGLKWFIGAVRSHKYSFDEASGYSLSVVVVYDDGDTEELSVRIHNAFCRHRCPQFATRPELLLTKYSSSSCRSVRARWPHCATTLKRNIPRTQLRSYVREELPVETPPQSSQPTHAMRRRPLASGPAAIATLQSSLRPAQQVLASLRGSQLLMTALKQPRRREQLS